MVAPCLEEWLLEVADMSVNKFTQRGFGASGAQSSGWSAPRDSYKAPVDSGTSFLLGGGGVRGRPNSHSRQESSLDGASVDVGGGSLLAQRDNGARLQSRSSILQGVADVRGGDATTSLLARYGIFAAMLVAALIFSVLVRSCGSDSSGAGWVRERRSHINHGE